MPTAPVGSAADQYAGRVTSIDGWIWPLSAAPGERVDLHVGTVSGVRYRVEFYRLGWYGGAGARLISCLPSCSGDQAGVSQPLPPAPDPATGMVRTSWSITDSLTVPAGWPSGTYMAALRITSGTGAGTVRRLPFVIRAAAPNTSKIVVVVPVNTWAAYNGWGGKSLYDNHSVDGVRASVVSFEKPWADGVEIQNWRYDEYPLVRFLERQDLDVSYITDWDVSSRPGVLAGHRVVVTMGHGEYWTKEHRDALEGARDAGQSLAFLGANLGYWQVRYSDGGRSLIGYKSNADPIADPALKTDLFRNVGRPECQLIGVQYNNTSWPLGTSDDMSVVDASLGDPWFAGSGFAAGASVIDSLGYEWDQVTPGCATPPLTRLFHWQASGWPTADGVRYTAPSGAKVFGAGTLQYAWGLDGWRWSGASGAADPRLVAFTMNMLTDMGGAGSSEPPPPAVTVTPASATLPVGGTQQFTATLQNATGGVTWSVDGGATNGTITSSGLYTAPASAPGGGVTVRATHTASGATDTATVTVTAPTQPQVTTQPTDQTALAGGSATFTAAASGTPTPTVQWQLSTDGGATYADIPGATSGSLTLTSVTIGQNNNRYRAVFTNSAGGATTNAATLTVTSTAVAPQITTQPANQSVIADATATFTAAATGDPDPAVQWQLSTNGGDQLHRHPRGERRHPHPGVGDDRAEQQPLPGGVHQRRRHRHHHRSHHHRRRRRHRRERRRRRARAAHPVGDHLGDAAAAGRRFARAAEGDGGEPLGRGRVDRDRRKGLLHRALHGPRDPAQGRGGDRHRDKRRRAGSRGDRRHRHPARPSQRRRDPRAGDGRPQGPLAAPDRPRRPAGDPGDGPSGRPPRHPPVDRHRRPVGGGPLLGRPRGGPEDGDLQDHDDAPLPAEEGPRHRPLQVGDGDGCRAAGLGWPLIRASGRTDSP